MRKYIQIVINWLYLHENARLAHEKIKYIFSTKKKD